MKRDLLKLSARLAMAVAVAGGSLLATATPAHADTFQLNSCHITGADPCVLDGASFGTVTLTQVGTSVQFDVVLINGNHFVETGAGGDALFLFNDLLPGSTITSISWTANNVVQAAPTGGFEGLTNLSSLVHADGTGDWSALVGCASTANPNPCSPGNIPFINDLHFTVTNATLAQLEIVNNGGNFFAADIQCGATQPNCANGLTGPVDAHPGTSVPDGGATVMLLGGALVGLGSLRRRFRA
jgi:VPDSG-CTERM motif